MIPPFVIKMAEEPDQEFDNKVELCWRMNPAAGALQEMIACAPDRTMLNMGAPGVWTAEMMLQKPPVMEKFPPDIEAVAGWPIVPVSVKLLAPLPPELEPPPPPMANQLILNI
jgi:hypothetical protein